MPSWIDRQRREIHAICYELSKSNRRLNTGADLSTTPDELFDILSDPSGPYFFSPEDASAITDARNYSTGKRLG